MSFFDFMFHVPKPRGHGRTRIPAGDGSILPRRFFFPQRAFFKDGEAEVRSLRRLGKERGHAFFTGINDLDPDSHFIRALGSSPIKKGVVFHSIIGDRDRADHPGGSDGVAPYSSSHLDGGASEVIVRSGHSVHRSPGAMQKLLRILLLHLRENIKK